MNKELKKRFWERLDNCIKYGFKGGFGKEYLIDFIATEMVEGELRGFVRYMESKNYYHKEHLKQYLLERKK